MSTYIFYFFNVCVCVFVIELYELFAYFGNQADVSHIVCKYFLWIHKLSLFVVSFFLINLF